PIPNPQSPIPNPQSPNKNLNKYECINIKYSINIILVLININSLKVNNSYLLKYISHLYNINQTILSICFRCSSFIFFSMS
ncbi:MAG: hypothetical protein MJ252_18690, partial [archaeon]|nr:hypothetical protein [archaeon]